MSTRCGQILRHHRLEVSKSLKFWFPKVEFFSETPGLTYITGRLKISTKPNEKWFGKVTTIFKTPCRMNQS